MGFRHRSDPARDKQWKDWAAANKRELEAIGLPLQVYASREHWDEFVQTGSIESLVPTSTFTFTELPRPAMRRLTELLERANPSVALLSWLRVRLGEPLPSDLYGAEHDWLSCDVDGHVALFCTAGSGAAPSAYVNVLAAHETAIERLLASPLTTHATVTDDDVAKTWGRYGARGIYVFDGDISAGPYRRVVRPDTPVHIDELDPVIGDVVRTIRFEHLRFANAPQLSIHELGITLPDPY